MSENWLAYHGDEKLKAKIVALSKEHVAQNQLKQGVLHAVDGKGDLRACFAQSFGFPCIHDAHLAELLGWPEWLIDLQDIIFESLAEKDVAWWHVAFPEVIPVGVDLVNMRQILVMRILKTMGYSKDSIMWKEFIATNLVTVLIPLIVNDRWEESTQDFIVRTIAMIVLTQFSLMKSRKSICSECGEIDDE